MRACCRRLGDGGEAGAGTHPVVGGVASLAAGGRVQLGRSGAGRGAGWASGFAAGPWTGEQDPRHQARAGLPVFSSIARLVGERLENVSRNGPGPSQIA